jgi:hypothetical protein
MTDLSESISNVQLSNMGMRIVKHELSIREEMDRNGG